MNLSARKFDHYVLLPLADEKQIINCRNIIGNDAAEINNLGTYLKKLSSPYLLILDALNEIEFTVCSSRRLLQVAADTKVGIVYSDYITIKNNTPFHNRLIEYQEGSIRDDFNFGPALLLSQAAIKRTLQIKGARSQEEKAAIYDLRLKISIADQILHIPEFLYTARERNLRQPKKDQGFREKQFSYVAARNKTEQKALEKVATNYLKLTSAYLPARTAKAPVLQGQFPVEASIIIPTFNRKETIATAIKSALSQKANFAFNVIVVDNHSADGSTVAIKKLAISNPALKLIIPQSLNLNIGGCWNEAIYSRYCGKFAVQLDSDDLYSSEETLQKIINSFHVNNYAMVIGSYTLVNEKIQTIPPGLIDHREWTKLNGHNNALRVNGLGAPRAFNTSVLRQIGFPDVGYGEDYAVALQISRKYQIGRIYESLYLCRRWQNNTDAALSQDMQNQHDFYKDKLRTMEIKARQLLMKKAD
jgi:hypothetical protein